MGEKISRIFVLNFILEKFISMMSINYIDRDIKETKIARGRATTLWLSRILSFSAPSLVYRVVAFAPIRSAKKGQSRYEICSLAEIFFFHRATGLCITGAKLFR